MWDLIILLYKCILWCYISFNVLVLFTRLFETERGVGYLRRSNISISRINLNSPPTLENFLKPWYTLLNRFIVRIINSNTRPNSKGLTYSKCVHYAITTIKVGLVVTACVIYSWNEGRRRCTNAEWPTETTKIKRDEKWKPLANANLW